MLSIVSWPRFSCNSRTFIPAWTVPAVKLDRRDVFALGIARKVMAAFRGTPLEAEMQSALARLAGTLEGHISLEPAAMTEQLSVVPFVFSVQIISLLAVGCQ